MLDLPVSTALGKHFHACVCFHQDLSTRFMVDEALLETAVRQADMEPTDYALDCPCYDSKCCC